MSAVKKHSDSFYPGLVLALFLCALLIVSSPAKVYAAPPVYQCVGIGVAANSPGCTKEQARNGTVALVALRSALKKFDEAKAEGNEKEQAAQTIKIAGQLAILEYPAGADPIAAARSLLNAEVPKREAAAEKPLICDGFLANTFNPICWARTIAAVVGSLLMTVAAWALAIAGVLFNWSVMNAVILFKDVIFVPIEDGINIGWTAFRDISNIVIIGVFAFIAISIILGNKEFGQKKLVARVLIIAVLINFSLLFTKLIIDASNFTAGQFYAATQGGGKSLSQIIDAAKQPGGGGAATNQVANPNTGVDLFSGYAQEGIAGQFVRFLGVIDVADTYSALKGVGNVNNNGWIIIVHALFAFILLLGAAIVLFYGSFLLISRAVLLIFLLLTSAIAFASHLIPKMSDGQFGWSAWWKSLLGSAVLAPLLMIFLYITLQIASNLQAKSGTLGNLISGNAKGGDVNALFAYLIVLGLLFGSFKVASSFSAKIGGFNFAAMVPAIPLALGARMAGLAGRIGIGGAGTLIGERFAKSGKAAMAEGKTVRAGLLDMTAQRFKGIGKRDFNIANTGFFKKEIAGMAGLKGTLAGQTKSGGFEGMEKRMKERYAERAERMTYSDEELRDMARKAREAASAGSEGLAANKEAASKEYAKLKTDVPEMKETKKVMERALAEERARQSEEQAMGRTPDRRVLEQKQNEINIQDQRIRGAEKRMSDYETQLTDIKKQEVELEEKRRQAVEGALPKGSVDEKTGQIKPFRMRLGDNATEIAHKRLTNLPFVYGGEKAEDDRIAKQMRKVVGDTETNKYLKRMLTLAEETRTQEEREHREVLRQGRTTQRIIRESGESGTPPPADTTKH